MLSLVKTIQRASQRQLLVSQKCHFNTMTSNLKANVTVTHAPKTFEPLIKNKGKFVHRLPDYAVSTLEASSEFESLSIQTNVDLSNLQVNTHPLEAGAKSHREKADIFAKLKANQLVLTNLPIDLASTQFATAQKLKAFLLSKIHPDIEVEAIDYFQAITAPSQPQKTAYIRVTMGSRRQAHMVAKGLRKQWLGDSLLKVKLPEDTKREVFDNRTILLRNLPTNLNQRQILEIFATEEVGAIVGIELPMENIVVADYMAEKALSGKTSVAALDKEKQFRAAQLAVEQSLEQDQRLVQGVRDTQQQKDFLATEKMNGLLRMVTRLQAEGTQVLTSKMELLKIRESSGASITGSQQDFKTAIQENRSQIEQIVNYLKDNQASASLMTSQPIEEILKLSQGELTHAYDTLIQTLDDREALIEKRIGESLKHFGITERIIVEQKDFDRELEDIAATYQEHHDRFKAEELVSVQEQIQYVLQAKNMSPEEKFARVMKKALNPFIDLNMNRDQFRFSEHDDLDEHKNVEVPDPRLPRSVLRMLREGSDFKPESREIVEGLVQDLRDRLDVPFDELYHKEKNLVSAVVKAQKDFDAKEASLKNPSHNSIITAAEEQRLTRGSALQSQDMSPVQRNQIAEEKTFSSMYEYKSAQEQELNDLVASGQLTKSEAETIKQLARESEHRNLGYCFLTFSHSDEARVMLLRNTNPYLHGVQIQIDLKSSVDHGELDFNFFINKARNDAKLVDEIARLRAAKQELKKFETTLNDELPSRIKLEEFRKLARDIIEDAPGTTRQGRISDRTKDEEDRLKLKIKQLQDKYPHVDMTQLYDTQKAEDARRSLHKKAFASYKAYEFLKGGVSATPVSVSQKSEAKRRLEENDPYNFPQLDQTVHAVLSKNVLTAQLIDHGEQINVPGRRFKGYTDREFLEAYFGKDMMRQAVIDKKQDALFMPQESLKDRYPVSGFLKSPAVDAKIAKLKSLGLEPSLEQMRGLNLYPKDGDLAAVMREQESGIYRGEFMKDREHPNDPKRTLLKDLESMVQKMEATRESRGQGDSFDIRELSLIRQNLKEEYQIGERDWFDLVKRGKYKKPDESDEEADTQVEEKAAAKFQTDFDSIDSVQKRVNREFVYNIEADVANEKMASPTMRKVAEVSGMTPTQLLKQLRDRSKIKEAGSTYGGKWFKDHELGIEPQEEIPTIKSGKSLTEFANGEDVDVYEQYQKQLKKKQEEPQASFNIDKDLHQPEMPRFESYFQAQGKGMHPFDQIKDRVDASNPDSAVTEQDQEEDRQLYARELMGRLMCEKLTPRQFEMLTGQYTDSDAKLQRVKDQQNDQFISHRDTIRINEEHVEKLRRKKVASGEWTEGESHQQLAQHLQNLLDQQKSPNQLKIYRRELQDVMEALSLMDNPERLLEKEYHFDEGLGQSLNAHVNELQQKYPEMNVQTRRDRDGFAIVRITFQPEYKYNIDDIEEWDRDKARAQMNRTVETLLASVIPDGDLDKSLSRLMSKDSLQNLLKNMTHPDDATESFEFDAWTKLQIQDLASASTEGKLTDNELLDKLNLLSKNASFDLKRPITAGKTYFGYEEQVTPSEELIRDRERFRFEVSQQLVKRIKKHVFNTKRVDSDFVQGRISEKHAFHGQKLSHDNAIKSLEQDSAAVDQSKDFDREAYEKIKAEISARKEAKERLLSQGLPEFKAYLRF